MTQNIFFVPAARLSKSPTNVRKSVDPAADLQLEANIAARGIIQNLIGLPIARKKGYYRITAGGRRLDCVHRLIERGVFADDYEVPLMVVSQANDAIEISLSENFFKLSMNPADACRAFQDIIETEKKTPADIAKRFGLTERFVHGRLRLSGLAEPVFEALRDGAITLDIAMAYASASDIVRQAAVFEQVAAGYYRTNVNEIRRMLASGGYKGSDPKALLVGRDAYVGAGGRIDSDLFSDNDTEIWTDGDILDTLATERLRQAADAIRNREGYAEVRTIAAGHVPYSETFALRNLEGTLPPLTAEAEARKVEIEAEIQSIETDAADADDYSEDQSRRIDQLEEELAEIIDRPGVLNEVQKACALAYVVIGADGQPQLHEQLFVAPAPVDAAAAVNDGDDDGPDESDVTKVAKLGISQRLADELAMMKVEILATHVARDPHFAFDLATFLMAEAATRRFGTHDLPTELRAPAPAPRVQGFESCTVAAEAWAQLEGALDRSWADHEDLADRYDAFRALDETIRRGWFSWSIARTLQAVPAGRNGSGFLDHLGKTLEIDVATWWRPTAKNYFDRISRPMILSLFEEVGGKELSQRYGASKKHDLAVSAEKLFGGEIIIDTDIKERALAWLPVGMQFALPLAVAGEQTEEPSAGAGGGCQLANVAADLPVAVGQAA